MSSIDDAAGSGRVWGGVGPKPWWFDDPDLAAARGRVLEEFGGDEPETPVCDEPEAAVCDESASSIEDGGGSGSTWGGVGPKPWWFEHPELEAARRRVLDAIERAPDRPDYSDPDLVLNDMLSGASVRELGHARDDLACARMRYEEAIRSARNCGLSWGEIGSVLGVPRQLLHRRFARRLGSGRGPIER
ncbi:MAG: hypothetical protein ACXWD8_13740 [Mycobacterium sp.]